MRVLQLNGDRATPKAAVTVSGASFLSLLVARICQLLPGAWAELSEGLAPERLRFLGRLVNIPRPVREVSWHTALWYISCR